MDVPEGPLVVPNGPAGQRTGTVFVATQFTLQFSNTLAHLLRILGSLRDVEAGRGDGVLRQQTVRVEAPHVGRSRAAHRAARHRASALRRKLPAEAVVGVGCPGCGGGLARGPGSGTGGGLRSGQGGDGGGGAGASDLRASLRSWLVLRDLWWRLFKGENLEQERRTMAAVPPPGFSE